MKETKIGSADIDRFTVTSPSANLAQSCLTSLNTAQRCLRKILRSVASGRFAEAEISAMKQNGGSMDSRGSQGHSLRPQLTAESEVSVLVVDRVFIRAYVEHIKRRYEH